MIKAQRGNGYFMIEQNEHIQKAENAYQPFW